MLKNCPKEVIKNVLEQFREGCDIGKDCVIVCKETIEIEANRIMLLQSPVLSNLISNVKCGCDHPEKLYLVFPDISYKHMHIVLDYFYTGDLRYNNSDKEIIKEILFNLLQVPKSRLTNIDKSIVCVDDDTVDEEEGSISGLMKDCGIDEEDSNQPQPLSPGSISSSSEFSGGMSSPEEDGQDDPDDRSEETSVNEQSTDVPRRSKLQLKRKLDKPPDDSRERNRSPKGEKKSRHYSGRNVICLECSRQVEERVFPKHLITHLYHLWDSHSFPEYDSDLEAIMCPETSCQQTSKSQKYFIQHYGLVHGDLDKKLESIGKTVDDFMKYVDEFNDESTIDSNEGCDETTENSQENDDETIGDDDTNGNISDDDSEATQPLQEDDDNSRVFDFKDD